MNLYKNVYIYKFIHIYIYMFIQTRNNIVNTLKLCRFAYEKTAKCRCSVLLYGIYTVFLLLCGKRYIVLLNLFMM